MSKKYNSGGLQSVYAVLFDQTSAHARGAVAPTLSFDEKFEFHIHIFSYNV